MTCVDMNNKVDVKALGHELGYHGGIAVTGALKIAALIAELHDRITALETELALYRSQRYTERVGKG